MSFSFSNLTNGRRTEVTVRTATLIRVFISIIIFLGVLEFLSKITTAILLLVVAFFLALALNAPVQWIARRLPNRGKHERRALATVISFLIVIVILGGFIATVAPPIVNQSRNFINNVPRYVASAQNQNSEFSQFIRHYHLQSEAKDFGNQLKNRLNNFAGTAVNAITTVVESVVFVLTVLVLTFLMLVEGPRWLHYAYKILPDKHEKHAEKLAHEMYRVVRGYVNGQVILAAIAAILILPALLILHVSYPIALTFVIFLFGLMPFIGHTISATIITIVALFHSWIAGVIILAYYILYINIENYVIQPRLQSLMTRMSPLTVFAAVVIGVSFYGIVGGLLAIPVAGCIKVLVVDYIDRKKLIHLPAFSEAREE